MELKLQKFKTIVNNNNSFNRTFMELKLQRFLEISQSHDCFNRTFMELKFGMYFVLHPDRRVLIVPLWN